MPVLDVLSGNQLQAVSGRRGRPVLGDLLLAARADLPGRMAFQQRERELALQEQEQQLQAQALAVQERAQQDAAEAQRRGQRQQVIGTAISGVGQAAQVATLAHSTGVLKSLGIGGSSAASGGAAVAPSTAAGTALIAAEESAGLAGAQSASAAAPAASGAAGTVGALAAGAGGGVVGTAAGRAHQAFAPRALELAETFPFGFFLPKGATRKLAGAKFGAVSGAATGFVLSGGNPIGAIAGGILGGLGGAGICIILTACAENAEEIALAKRYREWYMSTEAKRGYYMLAEPIAARMQADEAYRQRIRHALVLPLLRYGAHALGETDARPSLEDQDVAGAFLDLCQYLGRSVPQYVRYTGEVV